MSSARKWKNRNDGHRVGPYRSMPAIRLLLSLSPESSENVPEVCLKQILAGLLTYPVFRGLPIRRGGQWPKSASEKRAKGLTVAGTVSDLHGIPFSASGRPSPFRHQNQGKYRGFLLFSQIFGLRKSACWAVAGQVACQGAGGPTSAWPVFGCGFGALPAAPGPSFGRLPAAA